MSRKPWRVLVADDDPTVALLTQAALGGGEFLTTVVENGEMALAELRQGAFDIALLDVEMPIIDGFEVCAAIRQEYGQHFPVVLITGRDDAEFAAQVRAIGANYIAKPVEWQALAGWLRALLAEVKR